MSVNVSEAVLSLNPIPLSERVFWIGALDPDIRTFDVILKTANGTSYNAYAIQGNAGVAIVDTVKQEFASEFFARLENIVDYKDIKAIILNHLEPDHTGALPELLDRAPHAKVYISYRAQSMMKGLVRRDGIEFIPVDTGDEISVGDRTIRFLHTPYLHWPDTQCSYLVEESLLFSGDVFGCHFCDPRLFNDACGDFRFTFEYYYAHIMRPFKDFVIRALELIEPLPLNLIAPAHGPVLRDRPRDYVRRYHELAGPRLNRETLPDEKTLLVFYISAYGNTRRMAEAIYTSAQEVKGIRASLYDLAGGDVSTFADLVEEADGLVLGSPTINGDAVRPVWDLLSSLTVIDLKGKLGAAFGSYGWSGEAVHMIEDRLRGLKLRVPIKGVRTKLIPTDEEIQDCLLFGQALGEELMGLRKPRALDMEQLN